MIYSIHDYIIPGVIIPCIIIVMLLFICIWSAKCIGKKGKKQLMLLPLLLWYIVLLFSIFNFANGFSYPLSVILEPTDTIYVTKGIITEKIQAPIGPMYLSDSGVLEPATIYTVNSEKFYLLDSSMELGKAVNMTWITNRRIVLSWEYIQAESTDDFKTVIIKKPDAISAESPFPSIGHNIRLVCLILFVLYVLTQTIFRNKIATKLISKDKIYQNGIEPNKYGTIAFFILLLIVLGILIGWGMTGFSGAFLIAGIGGTIILILMIKKRCTQLHIQDDILYYSDIFEKRQYGIGTIQSVSWIVSRTLKMRALEIRFVNGHSIVLEQEYFWGLESFHSQISVMIENQR